MDIELVWDAESDAVTDVVFVIFTVSEAVFVGVLEIEEDLDNDRVWLLDTLDVDEIDSLSEWVYVCVSVSEAVFVWDGVRDGDGVCVLDKVGVNDGVCVLERDWVPDKECVFVSVLVVVADMLFETEELPVLLNSALWVINNSGVIDVTV